MKKISIIAAGTAALLATSALAQQTPPAGTPPNAKPPMTSPNSANPNSAAAPAASPAPSHAVSFLTLQGPEQFMASDLIGLTVRGPANESLGEIDDVVIDPQGRVVGAVIGVGGFLGVGEKDVAVPFQAVEIVGRADDQHAVLRKTKDELKAAPEFQAHAPRTTAGKPGPATPPSQ